GGATKHLGATLSTESCPGSGCGDRALDNSCQLCRLGDRRRSDSLAAQLRIGDAGENISTPLSIRREGGVAVWFVPEDGVGFLIVAGSREETGKPILLAVTTRNHTVERGNGGQKAVPFAVEHFLVVDQLEHGRHEVLAARVLFEAADQVADRDVELRRLHN